MKSRIPATLAALLMLAAIAAAQEPKAPSAGGTQDKAAEKAAAAMKKNLNEIFGLSAPPDPAAVDRGHAQFVATCGFCHGSNGNGGNSGPDLVRSVLVLHDEGTGKEIGPVILNGRTDKGMPKFALTQPQIHDVAAWLLSRSQSTANRMDYKILNIVTGDAAQGAAYFTEHCASCHTPTGDLAGVAAKYEPTALQARFLYPVTHDWGGSSPSQKAASTATVKTPSGKILTGTLVQIDDFTAVIKDANGLVHKVDLDPNDRSNIAIADPLAGHEKLLKMYTDADMHNILAFLETLK